MKKLLVSLLVLIMIFTFGFGTTAAFAAEDDFELSEEMVVDLACTENVTAKALGKTSIRISWNEVEGAEGYTIYSYSSSKKDYVEIKTVDSETTSYVHKGLEPDTTKTYKVATVVYDVDGNAITSELSDKTKATTDDNSSVEKLMKLAKSKLGCPYVSGAAGPNAFDCSGYVWYVYNKSGAGKKSFSRSSAQGEYAQLRSYSIGKNKSNAKVGDIIFFSASGSTSGINHVGIYAGGGKVIHAGSPRTGVSYCSFGALSACGRNVCAIVRLAK